MAHFFHDMKYVGRYALYKKIIARVVDTRKNFVRVVASAILTNIT